MACYWVWGGGRVWCWINTGVMAGLEDNRGRICSVGKVMWGRDSDDIWEDMSSITTILGLVLIQITGDPNRLPRVPGRPPVVVVTRVGWSHGDGYCRVGDWCPQIISTAGRAGLNVFRLHNPGVSHGLCLRGGPPLGWY